ncbi:RluA family pseudouridine synthase [Geothermobacter ehrlichii]|uniref:RluA family pseudouridine synthase n=1 Tax=Geothermobacter ehrlichii TaxID=213224 RepID=UPI001653222A|nr:RluA family pseudouridine synthase [Geothermobacter ehrlichii]
MIFHVDEAHHGQRLDRFLTAVCPAISRGDWKRIISVGGVHLDGRRMSQCSLPIAAGCSVEVFIDGRPLEKWLPTDEQILWRDDYLLALNKPAGIDCQPTPARFQGTVYQGVLDLLGRRHRFGRKPEIGMVQRLDRDTSGVMVFSIHPRAHRGLTRQFSEHSARKFYLALVHGRPEVENGEFRSCLARIRATNLVRSVERGGRHAHTRYRVLQSSEQASLVLVEPVTGRSHQIRAHFSEAGCPLVGDVKYGGDPALAGVDLAGHLLHAWRLAINHPVTGEPMVLAAPLPVLWRRLLACLELDLPDASSVGDMGGPTVGSV